jgi:hypothetical protein
MAALAPVVDKLEDVPEPARQFYVSKEGKYHVDLAAAPAGYVPAAELAAANGRVVEFRDTNIALRKQVEVLEPLKTKFDGIDPDAARAALAAQADLAKKGVKGADDVTAMVQAGIAAALKPVQDQLATITTQAAEERKKNEELILRNTISDTFTKSGGVPEALDFIVGKAKNGVFVVEGGVVKAAPNKFSADKPGELLGIQEWITQQTKEASFAFKQSQGGGASPVTPGAGGGTPKAGQLVLKDPTPQQLGEHAGDIKSGKMRVEYTNQ